MAANPITNPAVNSPAATAPLSLGAYVVASFFAIAVSDTQIAPVVAAFLGAAIVYNGIKVLGNKGGAATLSQTAASAVTPPTPIYA